MADNFDLRKFLAEGKLYEGDNMNVFQSANDEKAKMKQIIYTEQDLKDDYEQALKRGGKAYADAYIEGVKDGLNYTFV